MGLRKQPQCCGVLRARIIRETNVFEPNTTNETAHRISRFDINDPLSTSSSHPILLEEKNWLTCEHYFNANIVSSARIAEQIEQAPSALSAHELASPWFRRKRSDWKKLRAVLMTRALYTKVQMYPEVREALMETGDNKIIETSLYDYFWGVGRDQRGENQLGQIWMNIRQKLREE